MEAVEERALAEQGLFGGAEEFKKIVDAYSPPLLALAINVLGNRQDAEDACQEAFLKAYLHRDAYDAGRSFKTWLMTILYRGCLDQLRKRKRFRAFALRAAWEAPEGVATPPAPPDAGPRAIEGRLLELLSPRERTALSLWANEGCTAEEIARVIACRASTARVYLFNARKKIKAFMENDYGHLRTR